MLFPTGFAVYIDKVKGDEAVLSQAYSWGTPVQRDCSSLPKVTHTGNLWQSWETKQELPSPRQIRQAQDNL